MESARLAAENDLGPIAAIARAAADDIVDARGGALFLAREAATDLDERLAAALTDPDALLVVGCYDGVVLGYALAVVETLRDGRRLGVLEDLVVDAEARGAGIGEAIMNLVLDRLRHGGCFGVDSRALPGDRETKNFFESFGLKARLLTMHRSLGDDGGSAT